MTYLSAYHGTIEDAIAEAKVDISDIDTKAILLVIVILLFFILLKEK